MCDLNKPLFQCTLGDFAEAIAMVLNAPKATPIPESVNLPKGIAGIREIFSCSDYAARKILASGIIDAAIMRLGARTFVTDPVEAKRLYMLNSKA